MGPKRKKLLTESWAGVFQEHILRELPVNKIAPYFSKGYGRPTKELYAALGSLILQQMHDLTDEEIVDEFCFNIKWHYAGLDIPGESDESKYLSLKILWTLRHLVMAKGLDVELFTRTMELLAKAFQVDASRQRIDSVHIRSNMKRLGRIGIFSRSIPSGNGVRSNREESFIIFALTSKPCGLPPGGPESTHRSSRTSTAGAPGLNRPFPGWTNRPGSSISGFGVWALWATAPA